MTEWNKGYPEKRGVYKCRVDGKEQYLVHKRCERKTLVAHVERF